MADESRLSDLLTRWQEQRAQGRDVAVTELCRDCPELSAELARRIEIVRQGYIAEDANYPSTATAFFESGTDRRPETAWHAGPVPEPDDVSTRSVAPGARTTPNVGDGRPALRGPRYRPIRLHRTGGLGQVWLARDGVLGRDVALKELRADRVGDAQLRARFLQEARITGQLEHPSIVPLYDLLGEADEAGDCENPRYTMRFVAGRTLAEAIQDYHHRRRDGRATALDLAALLDSFVAVCHAIAYAHSRKVLHRDIKGSNIVLGDFGEVFVLDWGLAKVTDEPDPNAETVRASGPAETAVIRRQDNVVPRGGVTPSPSPEVTAEGAVIGTPAYMAPELADSQPASTATDIYALGVLLYVLLSGQLPYDGQSTLEVLEKIKAGEPPPPRALNPSAPAALETICLKAMARTPNGRYVTAEDLAADVRRWRADEPVSAHAEAWPARLGRWARRNRTWVAAAVVLLLTSVVALAVTVALVWREERRTLAANEHANREWARAEENLGIARTLAWDTLEIAEQRLSRVPGAELTRKEMIDKALETHRKSLAQRPDDPELQERTAKLLRYSANIHRLLGETEVASRYYGESAQMYEALAAQVPAEPLYRDMLAELLRDSSALLERFGRYREAEDSLRRSAAIAEGLIMEAPERAAYRRTRAASLLNLSGMEFTLGKLADSERTARTAADLYRDLPAYPHEDSHRYDGIYHAMALGRIAVAQRELNRLDEALAMHDEAIKLAEAQVAREKNNNDFQHYRGRFIYEKAVTVSRQPGRWPEAEATFGDLIAVWEDLKTRYKQFGMYREWQALAYQARGQGRTTAGNLDPPKEDLEKSRAILESLVHDAPDILGYRGHLGRTYLALGRLAQTRGEPDAAEWLTKARDTLRLTLERAPDNALDRQSLETADAELKKVRAAPG